ncbi:MAG: hypothetical protein DYG98_19605 [Haliscomenobacteraceae bacterium CHB4]|nr:hypothetical protein [Saprospiraceae bacterium]MCE7925268.1 hypothetical protein [Haliscomenobacteraceae bacterium CHB4]
MQVTDWTYEEFRAFAMLFAANADSHITPDEEDLIRPTLTPGQYEHVKKRFLECSDAEALDTLLLCKEKYCSKPGDKERVLADMRSIYEAHHGFEQIEREVHHMFERLFK